MKFAVSAERKCQAAKPYESFSVFLSLEGDTANETPEALFERAEFLVDGRVVKRKIQLAEEYQQELDARQKKRENVQ